MMNTTYFLKRLRYLIEAQQPFIAYWHEHGYGILRTGEVNMYLPDGRGGRKLTTCRPSVASVKRLHRLIEKMRADWKTRGSLTVIEYDGMNLDAEGNPEIVEVLV